MSSFFQTEVATKMEYVVLMSQINSKSDFSQTCQLLLSSALWGEADLTEKFLQVLTTSLCDRNAILFSFCLELPSWHGHHSTGHRNASQLSGLFFSLSSSVFSTSAHSWCQGSASSAQQRTFLKSNLNSLLSCLDGKKCLSNIETRAVSVAQKTGIIITLPKVTLKVLGLPGV